jgi:hypothetical protein
MPTLSMFDNLLTRDKGSYLHKCKKREDKASLFYTHLEY